jgi:hypothetical protein
MLLVLWQGVMLSRVDVGLCVWVSGVYEGEFIQSGRSIRGEGKVEQEKYGDMITCGYFSLITMDDGPDEVFDTVRIKDGCVTKRACV